MAAYKSLTILGRQPALGLAELESLYGADSVSGLSAGIAGLNLPTEQVDFDRLGGSTRLAEIVAELPSKLWKDVEKQLAKTAIDLSSSMPEGKLQLGLSSYNIPITTAKLNATGLTLKKILRSKTGRSVRVTPNPELELNTAQVLHNHLTGPTGLELLVVAAQDGHTIIARTVKVQDIASYTMRDRARPKRDAKVGMLPPKLAQIIINLAANRDTRRDGPLWDPFCGTGVLLQEALLNDITVLGTDIDSRMIEYSCQNLTWLDEKFNQPKGILNMDYTLQAGDATTLELPEKPEITCVASETYLGRPFTNQPDPEILAKTISECNLILKKFLQNIHSQLGIGTRLCLAVPAWQIKPNQFKHLPLVDQLSDLGYNRVSFEHVRDDQLLYYREDQIVARELLVLTRK